MTKLYKKSELAFALVWIGIYVVSFSLADGASASLGIEKCVTLPLAAALTAILWLWIRKQGLSEKFGLFPFRGNAASYLYFLPLVLIPPCCRSSTPSPSASSSRSSSSRAAASSRAS